MISYVLTICGSWETVELSSTFLNGKIIFSNNILELTLLLFALNNSYIKNKFISANKTKKNGWQSRRKRTDSCSHSLFLLCQCLFDFTYNFWESLCLMPGILVKYVYSDLRSTVTGMMNTLWSVAIYLSPCSILKWYTSESKS